MPRGYATTRLGQVHFESSGEGPPLVLLPASKRSSRMFATLIPHLAPKLRAIAPDLPGFGNSDPLPPGTSIETLAGCLLDLLDQLGIAKANVYGLHTGNKIGAALAVMAPARVDRLILAGQTHSLIPDQTARNSAIEELVSKQFAQTYIDTARAPRASELTRWADLFRRITSRWWDRAVIESDLGTAERAHVIRVILDDLQSFDSNVHLYQANFAYDLGRDFRRISVPTLILEIETPHEDQWLGRQGTVVQGLIPDAMLARLEEPSGDGITLEHRAADLARIILDFVGPSR